MKLFSLKSSVVEDALFSESGDDVVDVAFMTVTSVDSWHRIIFELY